MKEDYDGPALVERYRRNIGRYVKMVKRITDAKRRCLVTKNLCGTDTWAVGQPCQCHNCQNYLDAHRITRFIGANHPRQRESLRGDSPPRQNAGERVARPIAGGSTGGSGYRNDADTTENIIFPAWTASSANQRMPDKRQLPCVVSKWEKYSGGPAGSECGNLIAYDITGAMATIGAKETNCHTPLRARAPGQSEASTTTAIMANTAVRRLTPRECERLQGFPDDYTLIRYRGKPAADGPRCRALGNSMAVPVMRWIGERIAAIKSY